MQPFHIPSGSMEDTLIKDDRVLVSKLTPGPFALHRGDIVVFTDPDHWLGDVAPVERSPLRSALIFLGLVPDDSHEHLIKRVIGLPGDHVTCCTAGGQITVNGSPITEPYIKPGDSPGGGRSAFDIVVPADKVWVMGDHRSDSADSRPVSYTHLRRSRGAAVAGGHRQRRVARRGVPRGRVARIPRLYQAGVLARPRCARGAVVGLSLIHI